MVYKLETEILNVLVLNNLHDTILIICEMDPFGQGNSVVFARGNTFGRVDGF